jgi:hypothetical protein
MELEGSRLVGPLEGLEISEHIEEWEGRQQLRPIKQGTTDNAK